MILKLLGYEFLKIYKNKLYLITVLILFIVNIGFFNLELRNNNQPILQNITVYLEQLNKFSQSPINQAIDYVSNQKMKLDIFQQLENLKGMQASDNQNILKTMLDDITKNNPTAVDEYNKKNYHLLTGNISIDSLIFSKIYSDLLYVKDYQNYIESVTEQGNSILQVSIFNESNSFSSNNIKKTQEDFSKLKTLKLKYGVPDAIQALLNFKLTDMLILGLMFAFCIFLFLYEKERDLFRLIRATIHGKLHLVVVKLLALILNCIVLTIIFYGGIIIIAHNTFGFGDLTRFVQSIPDFRKCILILQIWQFGLLFLSLKALIITVISLLMLSLFIFLKDGIAANVAMIMVFGVSYVCSTYIEINSYINYFKFINLLYFLDISSILLSYQNLNFFNHAVNVFTIFCILTPILFIFLSAICILGYYNNIQWSISFIKQFFDFIRKKLDYLNSHTLVSLHELNKLYLLNKVFPILAILMLLLYYQNSESIFVPDEEATFYKSYIADWSGPLTDKTLNFVNNEEKLFAKINNEIQKINSDFSNNKITFEKYNQEIYYRQTYISKQKSFNLFKMQIQKISPVNQERKIIPWVVDLYGYNRLFATKDYSEDLSNMLLAVLILILCVSSIFSYENQKRVRGLLSVCVNGRFKLANIKYVLGISVTLLIALIINGAQFIDIRKSYDLSALSAPIQSVPELAGFPLNINIFQYFLLICIIRFVALLFIMSIIFIISLYSKNIIMVVCVSATIFVSPILLSIIGVNVSFIFPLIQLQSGNMLFLMKSSENIFSSYMIILLTLALIPVFYLFIVNIFSLSKFRFRSLEKLIQG